MGLYFVDKSLLKDHNLYVVKKVIALVSNVTFGLLYVAFGQPFISVLLVLSQYVDSIVRIFAKLL